MTQNPYTYGRLTSSGPTYWGEIHAAPRHYYPRVTIHEENLWELLPTWHQSFDVDNAHIQMCDRSLQVEVHQYQCLMRWL